jgi:uncharacterized membrane protein
MATGRRSRTPQSSSYLESWHSPRQGGLGRLVMLWAMAVAYLGFGLFHLIKPDSFLAIMPPAVPFPREVVLATGACEVLGALGLLIPQTRRFAAVMLALYALCVWPANLHHALAHVHVAGLPDSWWYHGPRLALQPVIAWWPLFAAGVVDWPFGRRGG